MLLLLLLLPLPLLLLLLPLLLLPLPLPLLLLPLPLPLLLLQLALGPRHRRLPQIAALLIPLIPTHKDHTTHPQRFYVAMGRSK